MFKIICCVSSEQCIDKKDISGINQCRNNTIGLENCGYRTVVETSVKPLEIIKCTPCKDKDIEITALKRQLYNIKDLCSQGIE